MDKNEKYQATVAAFARKFDGTAEAELILRHLSGFCCENTTTMNTDVYMTVANEGRRQVMMEIRRMIRKGKEV